MGPTAETDAPSSRRFAVATVALVAAIILYQLVIPPVVGLADNGDFSRTIHHAGVTHLAEKYEDRYFGFINTKFAIRWDPAWDLEYLTSEILLVRLARYLNAVVSKDGLFDLRVIGVVHTIVLLGGVWLIAHAVASRWPGARVPLAVLLVLVVTDVGYVAYLNSFYGEAASTVSLAVLLGIVLAHGAARRANGRLMLGYFGTALFFVCAKPSNSVLGFPLALFGFWLFAPRHAGLHRHGAVALAGSLCLLSVLYYSLTPRSLSMAAIYDMMFHEILPNSPSPDADLRAFGLDPALAQHAGTNAWTPNGIFANPEFRAEFYPRVTYPRILLFYAMRPDRSWELIQRGATHIFSIRPWVMGNFERSEGLPPLAQSQAFALWSGAKGALPKSIWLLAALSLLIAAASVDMYRAVGRDSSQYLAGLNALCLLMALMQFGVSIFAEGDFDLARHLFLFNVLMDVCLAISGAWLVGRAWSWWRMARPRRMALAHLPRRGAPATH